MASGNCGENKVKKKGFLVQLCLRKAWGSIFTNAFFLPCFPAGERVPYLTVRTEPLLQKCSSSLELGFEIKNRQVLILLHFKVKE